MRIAQWLSDAGEPVQETEAFLGPDHQSDLFLIFHECPICGERVFDRAAMRRIEAASPVFAKPVRRTA